MPWAGQLLTGSAAVSIGVIVTGRQAPPVLMPCFLGIMCSCLQIIQYGKVVRPIMGISFAPDQSGMWAAWTGL